MKKLVSILLVLALSLVSVATAEPAKKVGVAMPTMDLQRWIQDGDNMKKQLEAAGYEVDLQYANNDVATQVSQIENMLLNEVDVLVVASIDGGALGTVLQQVVKGMVLLAAVAFDVISKNNLIQLPKFFKKNNAPSL